jgi:catechol 2,3-dioxygenase-like lactoylglutathione lyase family enzyme
MVMVMKTILLNGLLAALLLGLPLFYLSKTETTAKTNLKPNPAMKFNAGIVTPKVRESKDFYTTYLGFGVTFENEWFVLLHSPGGNSSIAFMLPEQATQRPVFRPAFGGRGVFLTVEVPDVDAEYRRIRSLGVPIEVELRDEPWGERHFAIVDPNGIGVDIVTYGAEDSNQ